jgi:protein O-GlcNAc transferase
MKRNGSDNARPCGHGRSSNNRRQTRSRDNAQPSTNPNIGDEIASLLKNALAHQQTGQLPQAETCCLQILRIEPQHPDALHFLGLIAHQMGQHERAEALIEKSLDIRPFFAAHSNLGLVLQAQGKWQAAIERYRKALALNPDCAEAHNNLGNILKLQGRQEDAVACFQKAIAINPDYALAHANLGVALKNQGKLSDALLSFQRALALNPDDGNVYYNQGNVLRAQNKLKEAIASFRRALQIKPDNPEAQNMLLHTQQYCFDWADYANHVDRVLQNLGDGKSACTPLTCLSLTDSPAVQLHCSRLYAAAHHPSMPKPLWAGQRYNHDRIRVAYVSGDLRGHAVSILMAGVFEQHDRDRFEWFAVSLREAEDSPLGRRVKAAFPNFLTVNKRSDEEIARLMRDLEIDIAVDLMGFTKGSRATIFAHRPAPIQVNYLGFPGTMGAPYMDYILADKHVIPEQSQPFYSEKVVYLPDCFQANDDKRKVVEKKLTRGEAGLPEKGIVFCAFNMSYKITPMFFEAWLRILTGAPDSVLWLACGDADAQDNLRSRAAAGGVEPERLVFAPRLPYPEHLNRFALADLFLDTLPFNGGTTVSDALWIGVPVLTCAGQSFAGRMAGSLLRAAGLPELIADTLEEYEALAIRLANNPEQLGTLRASLAKNSSTCPLFDTRRFCRNLEAAYFRMWEFYRRGEPPRGFSVSEIAGGRLSPQDIKLA